MKAKELTYDEFMEYAKQHYTKGGDGFYECWDEKTFAEYVDQFGVITKRRALQMFKISYEVDRDRAGYR